MASITGPLDPSYVVPRVGDNDVLGARRLAYCGANVPSYGQLDYYVCTLPAGHWGDFHVAHVGTKVVGVLNLDPALRLPEGL